MDRRDERKFVSRYSLELMLVSELSRVDGCVGVRSIRIEPLGNGNWHPIAVNFGKADRLLCMETLQALVPSYQRRFRVK
jgi:hypothetical protein